jgi:hypothetical protein
MGAESLGSLPGLGSLVVDDLDGLAVATPPTGHLLHRLLEDLHVLDVEVTPHRKVVERLGPTAGHHVEPGEIAAGGAAVPGHPGLIGTGPGLGAGGGGGRRGRG